MVDKKRKRVEGASGAAAAAAKIPEELSGPLEVSYMATSQLRDMAAPYNPRTISDHDLSALGRSMTAFGVVEPVIVNRRTNRIIGGHQRVRAAASHGIESLPVVHVELDDAAEKQLNIALNRISGEFDEAKLAEVLAALESEGASFDLTGLAEDEIARLMELDQQKDPDAIPEPDDTVYTQAGDVITMGAHRLVCGDCTDPEALGKLLGEDRINGVFTSPPYAEQRAREYGGIPAHQYSDWWAQVQAPLRDAMTDDGSFFLNLKAHCADGDRELYVMELVVRMVREWGWAFVDEFCWLRPAMPRRVVHTFRNGFEPVYHFARTSKGFRFEPTRVMNDSTVAISSDGKAGGPWNRMQGVPGAGNRVFGERKHVVGKAYPSNVLPAWNNNDAIGHPAAFPVKLPAFFIAAYSDPNAVWVDPFSGSGSTLIACEQLERRALAMEVQPAYCDLIVKRWQEFTGAKAEGWRGNG